jgi:hypothetical protein
VSSNWYNSAGGLPCRFTIGPAHATPHTTASNLTGLAGFSEQLNQEVLPRSCYAMTETLELRPPTEFYSLPKLDGALVPNDWDENLLDATEQPPRTQFQFRDDRRQYACKVVTIRDERHQPVAAIFWVTRQDKETPYRLDALLRDAAGALTRDINHEGVGRRDRSVSLRQGWPPLFRQEQRLRLAAQDLGLQPVVQVQPRGAISSTGMPVGY